MFFVTFYPDNVLQILPVHVPTLQSKSCLSVTGNGVLIHPVTSVRNSGQFWLPSASWTSYSQSLSVTQAYCLLPCWAVPLLPTSHPLPWVRRSFCSVWPQQQLCPPALGELSLKSIFQTTIQEFLVNINSLTLFIYSKSPTSHPSFPLSAGENFWCKPWRTSWSPQLPLCTINLSQEDPSQMPWQAYAYHHASLLRLSLQCNPPVQPSKLLLVLHYPKQRAPFHCSLSCPSLCPLPGSHSCLFTPPVNVHPHLVSLTEDLGWPEDRDHHFSLLFSSL